MIELIHTGITPEELAEVLAGKLLLWIDENAQSVYHIALSGGRTPALLFQLLVEKYQKLIPWEKVHFWWSDERMVPPDDMESNYRLADDLLLAPLNIPQNHIHRIRGEADPLEEARRYEAEIKSLLPMRNQIPFFDLILLGLGEDGHTASIFPNQLHLFDTDRLVEISMHPVTLQVRITFTGRLLNSTWKIAFLVTGKSKAKVLGEILHHHKGAGMFPAAHIHPIGELHWFIDSASMPIKSSDY
ncbi:MAG: 6-phosphogluconolactonase [Bacteroidota bacterium]|nr:6-phosphogluconolactonase [Bacteroidota bacterium]